MKGFFITATDTDAGKTHVASLLLKLMAKHNKKVVGYKPVAAGAEHAFGELVNLDALTLLESGNLSAKYEQINPFIFEAPIAPHIAAKKEEKPISVSEISKGYRALHDETRADCIIAEGAGGWALPLSDNEFMYDWVIREELPVILVVGMKLGCLNHALLTADMMKHQGINCVGWIANRVDPDMLEYEANMETLKRLLPMPLLAISPYTEQTPKLQIYKDLMEVLEL